MNRTLVLEQLAQSKPTLVARFGVVDIALFGSTARDTARHNSDIDILVSFDGPATSERYFGVQFFLEDLLGRPVDLLTSKPKNRSYPVAVRAGGGVGRANWPTILRQM